MPVRLLTGFFFFCAFSAPGQAPAQPLDENWLRVTIENRSESAKTISIRAARNDLSGSWTWRASPDSGWVRYKLDPKETARIVCRKCSYSSRKFRLALFRPEENKWLDLLLEPNKFYWIDLNSEGLWDLYSYGADVTHYYN